MKKKPRKHHKTWACIKPDGDGCDGKHYAVKKPRKPGNGPFSSQIYKIDTSWHMEFYGKKLPMKPKILRKLAAWLIKAAEWIEAQEGKK